jgi:hypothetical protein
MHTFTTLKPQPMDPQTVLFKLRDAFNARDIDALIECFDENYESEQPAHPDRTFNGREQVRKNWSSNFNAMPDFSAQLINYSINNSDVWTEWQWQGTRSDNSKLLMRGVMIIVVKDDKIKSGKLYIEPVEESGKGIDAAVKEVMQGKGGKPS